MAIVLITGANRGIGLELTKQLHARNDHVVAVCRKSSEALEATGVQVEAGIDVTTDGAERLPIRLGSTKLDVVIHNAGLLVPDGLESFDLDAIRKQLEVNTLGPLRVTRALLPNLAKGAKIAILTSRMGSVTDNSSGGMYGYRMSKAALNMVGVSLSLDLKHRGVAVGLLHPGFVQTDMTGGQGNVDASDAARDLILRIDELNLDRSGTFRHANGEPLPW